MTNIKAPFGAVDQFALVATGTTTLNVTNSRSLIDGVTVPLTGNAVINLTLDSRLEAGAKVYMKVSTTGLSTVTFGTGFTAPLLTGVAGKTFVAAFYYDGSKFLPTAAPYQIN